MYNSRSHAGIIHYWISFISISDTVAMIFLLILIKMVFYSQEKGFNLIIHFFFGVDQKDRDTFYLICSKIGCDMKPECE